MLFFFKRVKGWVNWLIAMRPDGPRYLRYKRKYDLHRTFGFGGRDILFYGEGKIICGESSYIGRYSQVLACDGCEVNIGKHCQMSHFIRIYTLNNEADQDFRIPPDLRKVNKGSVHIGDYVWIGVGVFINPGIDIGTNAVIGANSVVTRNIPPHSIAAGAPAKVIKFKHYIDEATKHDLVIRYWGSLSDKLRIQYLHLKPKV